MSAFLSFSQSMRHVVKAQNPALTNIDISTVLAHKWRSSSEETKRPHIEREINDRLKYHENMAKWKESEELSRQEKSNQESIETVHYNESYIADPSLNRGKYLCNVAIIRHGRVTCLNIFQFSDIFFF